MGHMHLIAVLQLWHSWTVLHIFFCWLCCRTQQANAARRLLHLSKTMYYGST